MKQINYMFQAFAAIALIEPTQRRPLIYPTIFVCPRNTAMFVIGLMEFTKAATILTILVLRFVTWTSPIPESMQQLRERLQSV